MQAEEAKAKYWATHGALESKSARNGGAHFAYISNLLKNPDGFAVGNKLSIAGAYFMLCVFLKGFRFPRVLFRGVTDTS